MDTFFAPAQRTALLKFKNQVQDVSQSRVMSTLLETSAGILVVLNEDRQIVALNHAFLEELGLTDIEAVLGLRIGESLSCSHAFDKPNGCGTTEHCISCGAAIAMMSVIRDGKEDEQICALVSDKNGIVSDICLQIKAKPIQDKDNKWVLFYAQDVTRQQFWLNMDRVFFHDINNTLTALYGNIQMLELEVPDNEEVSAIRKTIERLVNEVAVQKDFSHHKDATYTPTQTSATLGQVKADLESVVNGHKSSFEKKIVATWPDLEIPLETDHLLLSRILENMVINAMEATPEGGTIRITVEATKDSKVIFKVWNSSHIPAYIQKRIFQRYFSSKEGQGRGLGTYSMKLFGESHLKGSISFTSSKADGTLFTFMIPRAPNS